MNSTYVYAVQILFITGIALGSQILNFEDKLQWLNIARYAIYILTIKAIPEACKLTYQLYTQLLSVPGLLQVLSSVRSQLATFLGSAALLVHFEQKLFNQEFVFLFLGYLLVKYPEMANVASSISYGVGMACSYFEGYLVHVIPSDGANFVGFEENIRALEDDQGVCFPVKKLFIVITKTLYSPPNLKEFNKGEDRTYLELFNSLRDVERSVAGVANRIYRNTAYKIHRPGASGASAGAGGAGRGRAPPVCLAAECATPLHTLHKVLNNRTLYSEVANIDVGQVVEDFCSTLRSILEKSPQCRGKCELVYYDNDDPSQNLADLLLDRIRELAPNFEQMVLDRRNENVLEEQ